MSFVHGRTTYFAFGTVGVPGTPTDRSSYFKDVSLPLDTETAETTAFTGISKSYLAGLEDATISAEGVWDPTIDAHLSGIRRIIVAFAYGPAGSLAGSVKYSGNCILTNYELSSSIGDAVTFSAEFQVTGVVTRGVF